MPRSSEEIRRALGANQPVRVRTQPHGPFGVLQLKAELAGRLHTAGGAGRPSDPSWTIRRLIGSRPDTWRALSEIAARLYPDAFTLIDLRPLRSLVFGQRHKALDADLVRTIHGFDALLVLTGSTASANL